ncbi:MAG: 2-oxoacid:acceptor oxidoreductase family protein [Candidatus Paceibacterota bacterium]|jgi:pyruvate ferredoxin oxidoreductase gamma subunit|nr:2-oxoacid:acceptor oxidoreductase family protein [Candidatus Paceibacterota bacterium]
MSQKGTYFDTVKSPKVLVDVWHARGNQGAVGAVEILARLAMKAGAKASSFGIFGAEKAGAPIMAFNRLSANPIEAFYAPNRYDIVVILDPTIGGFTAGTHDETIFVVNTPKAPEVIARELELGPSRIIAVDATGIAGKLMKKGFQFPNTAMLGAVVHLFPETTIEMLKETISEASNLVEKGEEIVAINIKATEEGYEKCQEFDGRGTDIPKAKIIPLKVFNWWEFEPGGAIITTGNSHEKKTGTWRTERPVHMQKNCTDCMLCFQFCPDFCILVDDPKDPKKMLGFDYEHCKGCMICKTNCEFNAIASIPEARAKK